MPPPRASRTRTGSWERAQRGGFSKTCVWVCGWAGPGDGPRMGPRTCPFGRVAPCVPARPLFMVMLVVALESGVGSRWAREPASEGQEAPLKFVCGHQRHGSFFRSFFFSFWAPHMCGTMGPCPPRRVPGTALYHWHRSRMTPFVVSSTPFHLLVGNLNGQAALGEFGGLRSFPRFAHTAPYLPPQSGGPGSQARSLPCH